MSELIEKGIKALKRVRVVEYIDGELYIEGLKYTFPKQPKKSKIRNHNLPKHKQVWTRRTDEEAFDWSDNEDDPLDERLSQNPEQLQFVIDEVDRIVNGEWIFINGKPTYLHGDSYFFLQHFILEDTGVYPDFRDTILIYFRFCEIVDNARLCTGDTLLKGRRLGATSMVVSRKLRKSLLSRNKSFGITSKTGADAEGAFGILVNAFQNLKTYLKPQIEGNDAPKKVLSMKKQSQRVKKGQRTSGNREGLNNRILWRPTALNTFDSGAYEHILVDESGKFPREVPITKYLPIVTKCVKKGAKITGKLSLPTTVNSPKEGGAEYREVWESSNQLLADYLGQTKTGLYRIMIPAYYGFAGYIDQFGESVIENPTPEQTKYLESTGECPDPKIGAKQYLEVVRKNLENDQEALQEEIRMNPFDAEEVFETSNDRCIFDTAKLNERENELIEKLIDLGRSTKDGELGRIGWFHKLANGRVTFVDDPKGLWFTHKLLDEEDSNRFIIHERSGKKIPTNEEFGAAGLDPIASGQSTVDKGSDLCCMIRRRHATMDELNSGIPAAMLIGRMPDVDKMYEQVFNGLQYYGVKMLGERAPDYFVTYAEKRGLSEYLYGFKRADGSEVKGIPAQQNKSTMDEHARVQVMSSLSDWYKIPFIRLIRDRKSFSVRDRTDYDACMADGYALMALEIPFKKKARELVFTSPIMHKGRGII